MLLKDLVKNVSFDELVIYKECIWKDVPPLGWYRENSKIPKKYLNCVINNDFRIWINYHNDLVVMVAINWI